MNIKLIEQVAAEHNIDADSLRKTIENEIAKVERKKAERAAEMEKCLNAEPEELE